MKRNAMKRSAVMALALLSVYLMSTVGVALLALTCRCEHMHSHVHAESHVAACCCGHEHVEHISVCGHSDAAAMQFGSECSCPNHSTNTELYTAGDDEYQSVRLAVTDVAAGAASGNMVVVPPQTSVSRYADRGCRLLQSCTTGCKALRAPPVCA